MKKSLLTLAAAGALAFGGAASAQDLGGVLGNILGNLGFPTYSYDNPPQPSTGAQGRVYADAGGRWIYEDPYGGRRVIPGPVTYDASGNPMYRDAWGNWVHVASGSPYDRDGDGVADPNDRWPSDRRYW